MVRRTTGTAREGVEPNLRIEPRLTSRILEGFIRSEVERTGRGAVVVGLSGGLDSAVSTALAVRALGAAAVHAVIMPHRVSDPASVRDAERVVGWLGVAAETVDVTPMVDGFTRSTGPVSAHRLGNVMARCRMTILFDRSEARRALVLGTTNKTELMLGYGTVFGDMASALNPLGDLYKTQVRQLATWLRVPLGIRRKPPSADLRPGQSDESDLGVSYDDADRILALLVDARASRAAATRSGFPRALVDRIASTIVRTQFKRKPPIIAKLSTRSVGWDFRYPRDWRN